jgi:hypothetical protein
MPAAAGVRFRFELVEAKSLYFAMSWTLAVFWQVAGTKLALARFVADGCQLPKPKLLSAGEAIVFQMDAEKLWLDEGLAELQLLPSLWSLKSAGSENGRMATWTPGTGVGMSGQERSQSAEYHGRRWV